MGARVQSLNSEDPPESQSRNRTRSNGSRTRNCDVRCKLEAEHDATMNAYTASVRALVELHDKEPSSAFQQVLEAREACDKLRAALAEHQKKHRCAAAEIAATA
jgi:hypothetical protein